MSIKPFFKLDLNRSATTDQVIDSFRLTDCQELTFFLYFDQSKTRHDRVKFIWSVNVSGHCAKFILSPVIILGQLCDTVNFRTALTVRAALFYYEFEGNFRVQAPGGLYLEGRFIGRFFTLRDWGTHILRGLYM